MDEHLKNVKQELVHTQRLVSAKAASTSLRASAEACERGVGYCFADSQGGGNGEESQDRLNVCQNNIFKGNEQWTDSSCG